MFPNSPNIRLTLLQLNGELSAIGTKQLKLMNQKEVIGTTFSITSKEFYESKKDNRSVDVALKIQGFLYDGSSYAKIKDTIYKIERTYASGAFLEIYLRKTNIKAEDLL